LGGGAIALLENGCRKNLSFDRPLTLASQAPIAFNGLAKSGDYHTI